MLRNLDCAVNTFQGDRDLDLFYSWVALVL